MKFALSFLILTISLSTTSMATTYYVSPTGDDDNDGTFENPFETLSKAEAQHVGGDSVLVMDGTYYLTGDYPGFPLWIAGGALGDSTVWAAMGSNVIIDASGASHYVSNPEATNNHGVFYIPGTVSTPREYIKIVGFQIKNHLDSMASGILIYRGNHITIEDNTITQIGCEAISIFRATNIVIDGNTISHTQETDVIEEAIGISHITSSRVTNNTLTDVHNIGISLDGHESDDVIISNNIISRPRADGIYINAGPSNCEVFQNTINGATVGGGIVIATENSSLGGDLSVSGIKVYSNVAYDCAWAGFGIANFDGVGTWPDGEEPLKSDIAFVNNTAYRNGGHGIKIGSYSVQDIVVDNNLLVENQAGQLSIWEPDSVLHKNNLSTGVIWRYDPICEDDILVFAGDETLFCSTDTLNSGFLKLSADSFARNSGVSVDPSMALDFRGTARDAIPDLGAYEYDSLLDCSQGVATATSLVHAVEVEVENPDGTAFDTATPVDIRLGGCEDRLGVLAPYTLYLPPGWRGGIHPDSTPDCSGAGILLETNGYSVYPNVVNLECNPRKRRVGWISEPITLTFVAHPAVNVPGQDNDLQHAIDVAVLESHIFVGPQDPPAPYPPITMRKDVRVTATNASVEISGNGHGSIVPVGFPSDATSWARLEGFTLSAGDSTNLVARLHGDGRIVDCALKDNGFDPTILISVRGFGSPIIENSRLEASNQPTNSRAINIASSSSVSITDTWIDFSGTSNCYGIYSGSSPTVSIEGTVVRGPGTGIWLTNSGITGTIKNCVVDSTLYEGIATEGSGLVPKYCIVSNANLSGGSYYGIYGDADTSIVTDGVSGTAVGVDSNDPLYCFGDYSLRVDSYGNPENNVFGKLIGAFPVSCWEDTLARTSWFSGDTLTVSQGPVIPEGKTLNLGSATTLQVDAGEQPRIHGTLSAVGTADDHVLIQGSTESPGHWKTLEFKTTGSGHFKHVDIRHAETAISNALYYYGSVNNLDVDSCSISEFEDHGIYLNRDTYQSTGDVDICNTTIDMKGALGAGIWIGRDFNGDEDSGPLPGHTVVIDNVTITGNATGSHGLYINDYGANTTQATISHVYVSGLTTGTGIDVGGLSPTLTDVVVDDCKVGIELRGEGSPILQVSDQSVNSITDCATGMLVDASSPEVSDVSITPDASGIGILTDGFTTASFLDVDIVGGQKGIDAKSISAHTFREGTIQNYSVYGVLVGGLAYPDLGTISDFGSNNIMSTYTAAVDVKAKLLGSLGIIKAEMNYWGSSAGPEPMANVDASPWLSSFSTLAQYVPIIEVPMTLRLAPRQNPCYAAGATVILHVPPHEGDFVFEAFTVDGRKITEHRGNEGQNGGVLELPLLSKGRALAAGVYFLRLRTKNQTLTHKVVTLP